VHTASYDYCAVRRLETYCAFAKSSIITGRKRSAPGDLLRP